MGKQKPSVPGVYQPGLLTNQATLEQHAIVRASIHTHTGPIPAPEIIRGYEEILPGAADRIIKMAEVEQSHHHGAEVRGQRFGFAATLFGQACALAIGLSGIGGGIYLASKDKSLAGFGVFLVSLGTLVGTYLYSEHKKRQSNKNNKA